MGVKGSKQKTEGRERERKKGEKKENAGQGRKILSFSFRKDPYKVPVGGGRRRAVYSYT